MPVDKNEEPLGPGSTVAGRFRILSELGHGGDRHCVPCRERNRYFRGFEDRLPG